MMMRSSDYAEGKQHQIRSRQRSGGRSVMRDLWQEPASTCVISRLLGLTAWYDADHVFTTQMGGPIWAEALHDPAFTAKALAHVDVRNPVLLVFGARLR